MDFNKIPTFGAVPSELQIAHMNMERKAFFHFGINTFTNVEWGDGTENTMTFAPTSVDTDQWIRVAKESGHKLAIFTAKHHDGFCLWQTKYSEHSMKNSPYQNGKGDIVRQFTDSCHKYGMKVGIYFSPWDRNSPLWGKDEYSNYYADQLTELVTNYGEIEEIWWDGAGSNETHYDWKMWADIIKKHQPKALIFGPIDMEAEPYVSIRWVGNEYGSAGITHYASINTNSENFSGHVNCFEQYNRGDFLGKRYLPAEVDVSIRPGWFYHESQDSRVKGSKTLDDIWFQSVGRNAMMLLNFPPNRDGVVSEIDAKRAIESNERLTEMQKTDFALGASATADGCYEGTDVNNLFDGKWDTFFAPAADKCDVTIDIKLSKKSRFNVFSLSEVFERGERITEFSLEDAISGEIIARGTSVGRKRMLRFPYVETNHLRLTVKAGAVPLLRAFNLYNYVAPTAIEECDSDDNLMDSSEATFERSDDNKSVVLGFGGIYPFNHVIFNTVKPSNYEIFAFDGASYYSIAKGFNQGSLETVIFEPPIRTSYQIKIVADQPLCENESFVIFKKRC